MMTSMELLTQNEIINAHANNGRGLFFTRGQ